MRIFLLLLLFPIAIAAQDTSTTAIKDFYDLSLEDLMNIKVSVASVKEMTPRESPGIVTLITYEEIKNSGANDLIDVLKLVPGIDFGVDVEGAVGIGIRGSWASEGKALLLIDGIEINEGLYSTTQYGNHFSVDNIDRIEIIRGPGSVIYGNNAEYGVINIVTKSAEQINGAFAATSWGIADNSISHKNISVSAGEKSKNFQYSISGYSGHAIRSNSLYTDVYGGQYDMTEQSNLRNSNANIMAGYKNFSMRLFYDSYITTGRDGYDRVITKPFDVFYNSFCIAAKNKFLLSEKLSLTPEINYKHQVPWGNGAESLNDGFPEFKIAVEKRLVKIIADYIPKKTINIISGVEYFNEAATQKVPDMLFSYNNQNVLAYDNYSLFTQTLIATDVANIAAGLRYNNNSIYPSSIVPRFSVTKAWEKFHVKLLFSKAYRAPNIQNINVNADIKPEKTTIAEIETGVSIGKFLSLAINAFYNETKLPIIFYYDLSNTDAYANFDKTGTRGFETEIKWKSAKKYFSINYSFYSTLENTAPIENYQVPYNHDVYLAFPAHKINFSSGFAIVKSLIFNSAITIYGPRYAIYIIDEEENPVYSKINPRIYVSFNLCKQSFLIKDLDVSAGIRNALNEKEEYIQPYNSLHAPLPGLGRQFTFKFTYAFGYKK